MSDKKELEIIKDLILLAKSEMPFGQVELKIRLTVHNNYVVGAKARIEYRDVELGQK